VKGILAKDLGFVWGALREAVKWGWEQKTGNRMLTGLIPTALHPKTSSFLTLYVVLKFS
jgi:hypothetical protein